jgi:hypothetical protein
MTSIAALYFPAKPFETVVAVVLGSADHPSRYNDMRAILAALPHDFPELAEPASGAASQYAGSGRC